MAKNVKISKEVIASLVPQRNLLNAPKADLDGQNFKLNSVIEDEKYNADAERIEGPVRLRFMNTKTNQIMTFPIRGLLFTEVADVKSADKYVHGTTKVLELHTRLLEEAATAEDVTIPENFTIVNVEDRKADRGEGPVMYPSYSYEAFQNRVDTMKDGEEITDIYEDFSFMRSLPGTKIADRFKDIEPVKNIVISI